MLLAAFNESGEGQDSVQMIDSTIVRAHPHQAGAHKKQGPRTQVLPARTGASRRSSPCGATRVAARQAVAPERGEEGAMETEIRLEAFGRGAALERRRERVGRALEIVGLLECGEPCLLEHEPEPEEIGDVLGSQIGDDDASVRVVGDETVLAEAAQRFAQRVARHAERLGDLCLAPGGSWPPTAGWRTMVFG